MLVCSIDLKVKSLYFDEEFILKNVICGTLIIAAMLIEKSRYSTIKNQLGF